jgi:hypothetical protein
VNLSSQSGVGILEQLLEVSLEPSAGFRSWLQGIGIAAVGIVSGRRRVRSAVRFTARLDPDDGIDQWVASVRGRAGTEARVDHL